MDFPHNKLSKVCGMIYQLRHYVPLSTLKSVYYSMFNSHLQYSLLDWGRATKTQYHKLIILQNKIIRASLFCPQHSKTDLLYSRFKILKLDETIAMEYANLLLKYNHVQPNLFNNYFTKLETVHEYYARQKHRQEYFQPFIGTVAERKAFHYIFLIS